MSSNLQSDPPPLNASDVIEELCKLIEQVAGHHGYDFPTDCFCGKGGFHGSGKYGPTYDQGYRFSRRALEFVQEAVRAKMRPAPETRGECPTGVGSHQFCSAGTCAICTDAARYRWFRENAMDDNDVHEKLCTDLSHYHYLPDELDKKFDDAMAVSAQKTSAPTAIESPKACYLCGDTRPRVGGICQGCDYGLPGDPFSDLPVEQNP